VTKPASDQAVAASVDGNRALTVVALEGFEKAQRALHIFANELPPRASAKGEAVRAYAQQLDRLIASIVAEHPDHVIVICSPSAVTPPALPSNAYALSMKAISRDDPGADDGFVLITGPGTAHRENPRAARVVDVVPTVLFAAGLPLGRDMDGQILSDAFDEETLRASTLSAIQTYEAERVVVRRAGV
jgi:hypothetical protein